MSSSENGLRPGEGDLLAAVGEADEVGAGVLARQVWSVAEAVWDRNPDSVFPGVIAVHLSEVARNQNNFVGLFARLFIGLLIGDGEN